MFFSNAKTSPSRLFCLLLLAAVLAVCAGCASPDVESDLPWNSTQPWETTPAGLGAFNSY